MIAVFPVYDNLDILTYHFTPFLLTQPFINYHNWTDHDIRYKPKPKNKSKIQCIAFTTVLVDGCTLWTEWIFL